jgi:hypothetical protein
MIGVAIPRKTILQTRIPIPSWQAICLLFLFAVEPSMGVDVWTSRYSNSRHGLNDQETNLTPANVGPSTFGLLFRRPVDGQVHAQTLLVQGLSFGALGKHNAQFVATENDVLYAFDADSADGANAQPLWVRDFRDPTNGIIATRSADAYPPNTFTQVYPSMGMTGTPVIDLATQTIYAEVFTEEGTNFVHRLHALDITTGNERPNSPVVISAAAPGSAPDAVQGVVHLNPKRVYCRSSLILASPKGYGSNVVFLAYSCLNDTQPGHGWVLGYDAATLRQVGAFCASPSGYLGSFWAGGRGTVGGFRRQCVRDFRKWKL